MLSLDTKDIIDSLNFMSVIDIVSKMTSNFTNLMYIHQRSISQHSTDASKILHEHYYDLQIIIFLEMNDDLTKLKKCRYSTVKECR